MGCSLTNLFQNTSVPASVPVFPPESGRKRGWLPVLTVLFVISYGLMTMLVVEQGSTIESQRALIQELFRDSNELSAARLKALQQKNAEAQRAQAAAPKTQAPVTQNPSSQNPSAQAQNQPAPFSQEGPQQRTQSQVEKQKPFRMPSRPASDLTDDRRALIKI